MPRFGGSKSIFRAVAAAKNRQTNSTSIPSTVSSSLTTASSSPSTSSSSSAPTLRSTHIPEVKDAKHSHLSDSSNSTIQQDNRDSKNGNIINSPQSLVLSQNTDCTDHHRQEKSWLGNDHSDNDDNDSNSDASTDTLSAFACNICFEECSEPVTTRCGHLYCWPCLYTWLSSGKKICPVCKAATSKDTLVPLYGRGRENKRKSDTKRQESIPDRPSGEYTPAPPESTISSETLNVQLVRLHIENSALADLDRTSPARDSRWPGWRRGEAFTPSLFNINQLLLGYRAVYERDDRLRFDILELRQARRMSRFVFCLTILILLSAFGMGML